MKIKEDEGKVEVFDKLAKYYEEDIQKQYADGAVPGMTVEPELPDELLNEAREYTDTAVITICRFSGEGWDRKCEAAQDGYVLDGEEKRNSELSAKIFENGDFCLTNAENAMVEKVKKTFPHVIVVMNVGGIVDTKWFRDCDEIQSVLMAWQGEWKVVLQQQIYSVVMLIHPVNYPILMQKIWKIIHPQQTSMSLHSM